MKKTVKALWAVYAAALCFGFFQTTAAVSALLGLSEGQYVFFEWRTAGGICVSHHFAGEAFWGAEKNRAALREEKGQDARTAQGRRQAGGCLYGSVLSYGCFTGGAYHPYPGGRPAYGAAF